jgi:hypothetical protein
MSGLKDIKLFLKEAERELYAAPFEGKNIARKSIDSVDDQIDSFLIKFEEESFINKEDLVLESLRDMSLRVLFEQPVPTDVDDAPPDDGDDEEGTSEPIGSERQKSEEPADPPKLPIDIDAFTKRVARLALNADALLDVKLVVINRAFNYLDSHYDKAHVDAMREILDEQFDFNIDDIDAPIEAPYAVGAYAGGTGGLGGGG